MRRLHEWKDIQGNKVSLNTSSATPVSKTTSSGTSFKKRLDKLIKYYGQHLPAGVAYIIINLIADNKLVFTETYVDGAKVKYNIFINPTSEAWNIKILYDGQLHDDLQGTDWTKLLKTIKPYIEIPDEGTSDYTDLLVEWLDTNGNKINLGNSSSASQPTSSSPKNYTSQVKRYSKLIKQIDADGLSTCRKINKFNDTILDITLDTTKRKDLNIRIEYQPTTDDYILTIDGKASKGWTWLYDILELLKIGGVIKNTNLCESASSIADDFKLYENLWN